MKEFSTLNGYAVKDQIARETIKALCTTPQQYGAVADGVTDDTAAIQAAINTGKDVYFPDGTYLVTGVGLTVDTENQKLTFAGGAWIEAKNIVSDHALEILSMYNKLDGVKIRVEDDDEVVNAIKIGGVVSTEINPPNPTVEPNTYVVPLNVSEPVHYRVTSTYKGMKLAYTDGGEKVVLTPGIMKQNGFELVVKTSSAGPITTKFNFNSTTAYTGEGTYTITPDNLIQYGLTTDTEVIMVCETTGNYAIMIRKPVPAGNIGFSCHLHEPVVTGTGLCGLQVSAAEVRIIGGKFRGTKYGINVEAPDFYGENIYTEQCTADGFRARSGSIEAHHIHSYNNGNKGFNLAGINYSNFYGLYADKNVGDGVYMADNSGEVNVYGGWSFYSGYERADKAVYDWNFSSVKDLNLFGCRSSGGDDSKIGSYNVDTNSRVYFYGCMANISPVVKNGGIARFMSCGDKLKTYNTGSKSYKGEAQKIAAGATATVAIYLDEILNNTHDIMSFDCVVQYRGTGTYTSGLAKHILQLSNHYENRLSTVIEDENVALTVQGVTFAENGATVATLSVVNNTSEELQVNVTMTKMGSIY